MDPGGDQINSYALIRSLLSSGGVDIDPLICADWFHNSSDGYLRWEFRTLDGIPLARIGAIASENGSSPVFYLMVQFRILINGVVKPVYLENTVRHLSNAKDEIARCLSDVREGLR